MEGMRTKTKKTVTKLTITQDDSKVLGRTTALRREKSLSMDKVATLKLRTHNSAWTPIIHKPSNEQIFKERRDLVSHWFDLWTDSQRKRFLDVIFRACTRSQNQFVIDWFRQHVPMQHMDFTSVLPRFLALYIFSFLEPKSLCRASQTCWHWRFLADQDDIWIAKCKKYGWFLPYTPADNEYGAWKRHYIACVQTLDYVTGSGQDDLYGTRPDGSQWAKSKILRLKGNRLSKSDSRRLMDIRPPWQGPDYKPQDLVKSHIAFIHESNTNDPLLPKSALVLHNRWGITQKQDVSKSLDFEVGMDTSRRKQRHRALTAGEDYDPHQTNNRTLREVIDLENFEETRMRELVETDWKPPKRVSIRRSDLSGGGGLYSTRHSSKPAALGGSMMIKNPRVIFISSRIPAADLLLDAVMFGVVPIVYEYEGTTTETLLSQLESVLQGRHAQSVGLFCHSDEPGQLRLVHGCTVSLENFDCPESREFFETVSNHILPTSMGGQFDVFVPLGASVWELSCSLGYLPFQPVVHNWFIKGRECGMELIVQLTVLTGMQFSSPTGIIGSYNHVNTEWLMGYRDGSPPVVYFCPSKLNVWSNVADQALEAIRDCHEFMGPYFEKTHRDIAAQITGQVIFDALGQADIQGVHNVTEAVNEGLRLLGIHQNAKPLEFLGKFLLERSGVTEITMTTEKRQSHVRQFLVGVSTSQDLDDVADDMNRPDKSEFPDDEAEDEEYGDEETDFRGGDNPASEDETQKDEGQEKNERKMKDELNTLRQHTKETVLLQTQNLSKRFGTMRATKSKRLTAEELAHHPEKRTPVVFEILTSEIEYNRTLKCVRDVFVRPLKSALSSNRAIISAQNVQIIFCDILQILETSRTLTEDLKNRLSDWQCQHTCIGDLFVKFCMRLKSYTNFTNNYEVILRCIERCKEQTAPFRIFLEQRQRIPETKMLTLQELMLQPARRITEYVTLLSWFELNTPHTHPDREDLANAIATLTELDRGIKECKLRMERSRELLSWTRKIINSPALLEANRYLVKHQDAAHLKPPTDSVVPENRVYQHTEMFGMFLFNDALLITRRTSKHFPFSRAVEYLYKFEASVGLTRLVISDIPDSKYVKNAFKMETPKREWICSTETPEQKLNWISLMEQTIRGVIAG